MKSKEMKYAVAYARFSSDNQRTESIDAQLRAIEDYCNREGYLLVHKYIDEAQSATSDQRIQFQQMIGDAKNGEFQYVIVHKLDRFSRDRYDSAVYKRQLRNLGIRVISVLERLDESPESVILESLLEGMSEYYSKNLSREVNKGMKENALKCIHNGGIPALGYDVDSAKKYVINELEASTVRKIFDLYVQDYGYGKIADQMNNEGRMTKLKRPFSKNSIREILANEKYKGIYVFNKSSSKSNGKRNNHSFKSDADIIRIPGGMPQIVSEDIWNRANEKMGKLTRPRQHVKREYLLTGKLECSKCKSAYIGRAYRYKDSERYNYACNSKLRHTGCDAKPVLAEPLEAYVIELIFDRYLSDEAIESLTTKIKVAIEKSSDESTNAIKEAKKRIDQCQMKLRKLLDLYYDQAIQTADYKEEAKRLNDEISSLQSVISSYMNQEQAYNMIEKIKSFLIELRKSENKKLIIDTFIEKIIIDQHYFSIIFKDTNTFSAMVGFASPPPTLAKKLSLEVFIDREKFRG